LDINGEVSSASMKKFETKYFEKFEELAKNTNDELEKTRNSIENRLTYVQQGNEKKLDEFTHATDSSLEFYRESLSISLKGFENRFSEKLDDMSKTSDETLHKILEARFDEIFKLVNDRLEFIQKDINETQNLTNEVDSIKYVLSKTKEKLNTALYEIENADSQTKAIEKKLRDAQPLPEENVQALEVLSNEDAEEEESVAVAEANAVEEAVVEDVAAADTEADVAEN